MENDIETGKLMLSNDELKNQEMHFRCTKDFKRLLYGMGEKLKLKYATILELGVYLLAEKIDDDLILEGIDFKNYAKICYLEEIRHLASKERNEFLSKELFILRVRKDVLKLVYSKKIVSQQNLDTLLETVNKYIDIRLKEAQHYSDYTPLIKEIEKYKEMAKTDIPKLVNYLQDTKEITDKVIKGLKK